MKNTHRCKFELLMEPQHTRKHGNDGETSNTAKGSCMLAGKIQL